MENILQYFLANIWLFNFLPYLCIRKPAECSAVGSVLRSGRRGRAFESPHSDYLSDKPLKSSGLSHF